MNIRTIAGAVLILLGAYIFLNDGGNIGAGTIFGYFWPSLFIIPLALFFHWLYFSMLGRKGVGVLIPGGILFIVGIVCQISMLFDSWAYMWPGFIMAPAVGLFEFYWFGGRNRWLLIPINILMVLSILFFAVFSIGSVFNHLTGQPVIAILMIIVGAIILLGQKKEI